MDGKKMNPSLLMPKTAARPPYLEYSKFLLPVFLLGGLKYDEELLTILLTSQLIEDIKKI